MKNVGGEEFKNLCDMIHEQGYKLALQVLPSPKAELSVELLYENHFRASNGTSGLPADRLGVRGISHMAQSSCELHVRAIYANDVTTYASASVTSNLNRQKQTVR